MQYGSKEYSELLTFVQATLTDYTQPLDSWLSDLLQSELK